MNNFFRTIIAGYGAKKLGGGCFSTILVFIIIYYALGKCNSQPAQTRHSNNKVYTRPALTSSNIIQKHITDLPNLPGNAISFMQYPSSANYLFSSRH